MNVAIVGSRDYPDLDYVRLYVQECVYETDIVVSGGARGVDTEATRAHLARGGRIAVFHAVSGPFALAVPEGHDPVSAVYYLAVPDVASALAEVLPVGSIELALEGRKRLGVIF